MIHHRPSHWIAVALVILAAVLVFGEAHGQAGGAQAMFEGRPALAGAQAGLGAQAGPAQGGIGAQGSEAAALALRRPRGLDDARTMPQGEPDLLAAEAGRVLPQPSGERRLGGKDSGIAKDNRSTARVAKRGVLRTFERIRNGGVAQLDLM